ncbi:MULTISPECIES: NAD-dependent succinate-semialdehyde dehydrogenase [Enterobacteriaceae]|jgi:succinate-semialdehyde dehydrogenase/glutarate-semialdehyde dehydrogenase|uniref:NAD-dependent succinate-semialdehyde dehydrogenase n=1 Tax=Leclercia adecarboxylata TaxID=83655 RepID=A0A9X3YBQ8_9ENTR|nr:MULTISPECIES: NAD-dependent succinate-semialdehyde dehydrogenase [Enterobacteriaceae]ALZ98081.1 succinate-semialdehyde dehydrogenase [Leclercia adecarboxylata]MBD1405755.1 NAD-dependent succinate-semialdehyde dehydrogenase [Leclercia adecarboxylata]MBM6634507.1 NAD-dependent succinate-semialdehyde dehydrogenase [Leclercia adecarboxylata]MCE9976970.1 NAD-dependent succinate-semialdehyde dehydrogenase [Leclercia adecarboxylata]MCH2681367.1 NAD-dependent succinate-semialdehyde dehydrogenase [L
MAYQTVNPANNKLIKEYSSHTDADVEAALSTADALYHSDWSKGSIDKRLAVLHKLADLIDSRTEELAKIASVEMGKLIAQSRGEVKLCAQIARYYADNAKQFLAPVKYPSEMGEAWVEHHPIGVVMAVEPWNFPYYQLMRVLAPNLAAGNPVLAKHASIVPHCAETFAHLVREAGAPDGAWTNLFISSDQVANIIADDRVQGAALTGSEKAGSIVAAQAAKHIKKSTLELGGNDVFVVLDDADLEKAVKIGVNARLANAGQVCTAAKRFIVHEKVAEQFLTKYTEAFRAITIGDPLDENTRLGPLSSKDALETLTKQVDEAVKNGATLHYGGKPVQREGSFFEPTILTNITRDNPAYFEEFFGPVAQVYVVKNDDEAVKLANDSHYGLGGAVFSKDIDRAKKMASRIETGMVWINWLTDTAPELPFGGVKRSGYGRELSDLGIKEFVNQKLVVIRR